MIKNRISIILGLIVLEFVLIMLQSQVYGQLSKLYNLDLDMNLIQVGKTPVGIAVDPNTNRIYVSNYFSNVVFLMDPFITDIKPVPIKVGERPTEIAVDPNTNRIYVSNSHNNTVSVIDGATNRVIGDPIPVGEGPRGIAVDPNTHLVYVTNPGSNTVSVIDGATNKPS